LSKRTEDESGLGRTSRRGPRFSSRSLRRPRRDSVPVNHWTVGLLFHSSQQKDNDGAIERRSTVDRVSFRITGHYRLANPQFVTPCYGAGFVLRNGDKLREIIQDSLTGPQRHSFAAVLAFGYARFFVAQMFLTDDPGPNAPNHYNIFLLHPVYPDGKCHGISSVCRRLPWRSRETRRFRA
jgi:hypothetical protein